MFFVVNSIFKYGVTIYVNCLFFGTGNVGLCHLVVFLVFFLYRCHFLAIFSNIVSDSNPYIRFVFLCFFEMLLLLSSDIETQPGPNFNDSFFSFCNSEH